MIRKESLKNKLHELCVLCDIMAYLILYSPYEPGVELWPDDRNVFQHTLNQFRIKPEIERTKSMLNQESYLKERIDKVNEQLKKQLMVNREIVKAKMLSDCLSGKVSVADLNSTELNELVSSTRLNISEINERMELLASDAPTAAAPPQSQQPKPHEVVGDSSTAKNTSASTE
ncbi:agamous-like MADS-box protein AGL80 [Bidens hawaiensis]|uniref:agamous-like MADS-box protein AGL80 n=1 Tax=Bidens hawaiensis TaxID=980011 RepID=UPI004049A34B